MARPPHEQRTQHEQVQFRLPVNQPSTTCSRDNIAPLIVTGVVHFKIRRLFFPTALISCVSETRNTISMQMSETVMRGRSHPADYKSGN